MKYPQQHLIKSVDLYTQLLWHLPQLYGKNGSHLCILEVLKQGAINCVLDHYPANGQGIDSHPLIDVDLKFYQ